MMFRIVTYNVHQCIGNDGQLAPHRIAEVIAQCRPDIIALQELDVGRARSGGIDQAHTIARQLRMEFHYHPALRLGEEQYGDAILTALPMRLIKAGSLPNLPGLEPRGALWVAIDIGGTEIQVINTHLGLLGQARLLQVKALLGEHWLGHPDRRGPTILLGDFNMLPWSSAYRRLSGRLMDAQVGRPGRRQPTFPSRRPMLRIDHVFLSADIEVLRVEVPRTALSRIASDHLPLTVDFRVAGAGARP